MIPLFILVIAAFGAPSLRASSPDETVRRFLVLAHAGQIEAALKSPSAETEAFERRLRHILRVRCVEIEEMRVTSFITDADHATVEVEVGIRKRELESSGTWEGRQTTPYRFKLLRDDGRWLIASIDLLDAELAIRLLASDEERNELWNKRQDRATAGLARAVYDRALELLISGTFKEAAKASELAVAIARYAGDAGTEAIALGMAFYMGREGPAIMATPDEILALAEASGEPDVLARAWYNHGRMISVRYWDGRNPENITKRSEAYHKSRRFGRRAEDPTIQIRALYSLANIAANAECDYLKARRYIDEALQIAREFGDAAGEMACEMVLTTVYLAQGDRERGLYHHLRAVELAEKHHLYGYPSLLIRTGIIFVEAGRLEEGGAAFSRALHRTADGVVSSRAGSVPPAFLGDALRSLGIIEAEAGNLSEAECLMRESAVYYRTQASAFVYQLVPYYLDSDNGPAALRLALESLAEPTLYSDQKVKALIAAGRASRKMGDAERSLAFALEAIEIAESIDARVAGEERQRAQASGSLVESYELAADLAIASGDPARALAFLESGRARVLSDILENGRPGLLADAERSQQQELAHLERDAVRLSIDLEHARTAGDAKTAEALARQLVAARATRASFADGMRARSERRSAARQPVDSADVAGLIGSLPAGAVAVEYFVGERRTYAFVLKKDASESPRVICRTLDVERPVLEKSVQTLLSMLTNRDLRVESAARRVYEMLLAPIEKELSGVQSLVIVPDKMLWRVPFAALVDKRGRAVVERTSIVYASSLTTFMMLSGKEGRRTDRPVALFAVGNPTLQRSGEAPAVRYGETELHPLPNAEREVAAVRALYDSEHSVVLTRGRATEATTKSIIGGARIVQFATHTILDDSNPMYSRLALARDDSSAEDGWLESWEIARMNLSADIVVLSACDTARGRVVGGEGVTGMAWSFFLAGARSIVATQWAIQDDSTTRLMIAFHRSLRDGFRDPRMLTARALREAQLELLRDGNTRHPYYWAAFVLLGNPSMPHEAQRTQ